MKPRPADGYPAAVRDGTPRYFSDVACKRCKGTLRFTNNRGCTACASRRAKARRPEASLRIPDEPDEQLAADLREPWDEA